MAFIRNYYLLVFCLPLYAVSVGQSISPLTIENNEDDESLLDSYSGSMLVGIPVVMEEPLCDSCSGRNSTHCQLEDYPGCKCDAMCQLYNDCCIDPPDCRSPLYSSEISLMFTSLKCFTLYHERFGNVMQESYWMVANCPLQIKTSESQVINHQCTIGSVAPVSDKQTGIIYKNEFCASCHSVTSIRRWQFTYTCQEGFKELLGTRSVDLVSFLLNCSPCRYVIPASLYNNTASEITFPPRSCLMVTSVCQSYKDYLLNTNEELTLLSEAEFENAAYHCTYGPYNAILATTVRDFQSLVNLYKNLHCALCNGATTHESNQCPVYSDSDLCINSFSQLNGKGNRPRPTFNLLLDINKDGAATIFTTETVTSTTELQTTCDENQVFDPFMGNCRKITCPPSYRVVQGQCVRSTKSGIDVNFGVGVGINDPPNQTRVMPDTNKDATTNSQDPPSDIDVITPTNDSTAPADSTCSLMTLIQGQDDFTKLRNDSVIFEGIQFTVVTYDDSQNPIICLITSSFHNASLNSHHRRIKQIVSSVFLPPSLTLALIGMALQLILRKFHSVYCCVVINLGLALFLSDIFLLSTFNLATSLTVIHFFWHSCSLAVASWL